MTVRRSYVDVADRQLHVAIAGPALDSARPVVLLHQTPRSLDEFAEAIPLLAVDRPVVAVDLPGMGASDAPTGVATIESIAADVAAALDALGIAACDLVGHHTGGVVAAEIAATCPDLVSHLVLSSTPYVDAEARARRRERPPIDAVDIDDDGHFLLELWNRRKAFYPDARPDLLVRFVRDALRVDDPEAGHRAVASYQMERRIGSITAPTLLIGHAADPYAFPELEPLRAVLQASGTAVSVVTIGDGMVPLEFTATEFAALVARFLDDGNRVEG